MDKQIKIHLATDSFHAQASMLSTDGLRKCIALMSDEELDSKHNYVANYDGHALNHCYMSCQNGAPYPNHAENWIENKGISINPHVTPLPDGLRSLSVGDVLEYEKDGTKYMVGPNCFISLLDLSIIK